MKIDQSFLISNDLVNDPTALRQRMRDAGYLFFKGMGPKEKIAAARRDVLKLCAAAGWCDENGKWSGLGPYTEGDKEYMAVYKHLLKLPSFLAVPEDAVFMNLIARIGD